jgi:two-component system sensor histidine kinase/response regulator
MDVQRPEMDGLEATRRIREDPRYAGVPILAMTANAMKSDLDACAAAGMNDHVTKPIDRKALVRTLRRWLKGGTGEAAAGPEAAREDAPALQGIDVAGTVDRLGLEVSTVRRLLLRLGDSLPSLLAGLRAAVASGDTAAAAAQAHTLAGAAGNLGADALRGVAKQLEAAAREGAVGLEGPLAEVEAHAVVVARSIDSLRAAASAGQAPAEGPADAAAVRAALERLAGALDERDASAADAALRDADAAGLDAFAGEDAGRLRDLVEACEYGAARPLAARLAAGPPS